MRHDLHRGVGIWRRVLAVCGLSLAVPGSALAQQYPPSSEELTVSTSEASPGDPVTLSGGGYAPSGDTTITFESVPVVVAVAQTDASGQFTREVRVPADATPGVHTFRATGPGTGGGSRVLTAMITITPEPTVSREADGRAAPRSRGLARTGSSTTLPALAAALALMSAGALLLLQLRRRVQPIAS